MNLDLNDADKQIILEALLLAIDTMTKAKEEVYSKHGWQAAAPLVVHRDRFRNLLKNHFPTEE